MLLITLVKLQTYVVAHHGKSIHIDNSFHQPSEMQKKKKSNDTDAINQAISQMT